MENHVCPEKTDRKEFQEWCGFNHSELGYPIGAEYCCDCCVHSPCVNIHV